MVTLAWSGLGLRDHELEGNQMKEGLFVSPIIRPFGCSSNHTLQWYFVSGTIWTFWVMTLKWSIGFTIITCINRKYLAAMSTTLAAVSIATDWYMALM